MSLARKSLKTKRCFVKCNKFLNFFFFNDKYLLDQEIQGTSIALFANPFLYTYNFHSLFSRKLLHSYNCISIMQYQAIIQERYILYLLTLLCSADICLQCSVSHIFHENNNHTSKRYLLTLFKNT